jgi:type IV secretion system protein TrbC
LTTLSNSVTGPVAYGVSLIGIVGAGGVLIFAGGMVNEFLRAVLFCVLVIAFIIAAKNTLTAFGFAAGATVAQAEHVEEGAYVSTSNNSPSGWN